MKLYLLYLLALCHSLLEKPAAAQMPSIITQTDCGDSQNSQEGVNTDLADCTVRSDIPNLDIRRICFQVTSELASRNLAWTPLESLLCGLEQRFPALSKEKRAEKEARKRKPPYILKRQMDLANPRRPYILRRFINLHIQ
ncbi:uncharacterized protein LOC106703599 [Latimeria chalumnae]|uniref:uncharacterized protein LOC106703599 n=1 Tax=Latimeria chalumnae TaxID=7897 RepID=UPI0006D930BC|nr:PREDICTED: uncharacterized protein LOC106703599 isoform X2 [Latimeria chalumnae]|eukprot:XP_014344291.1 PREDICTED: uncharacterized protein LOC106703599 isoform X2 [Latimeria chalumnae]